MTNLEGENETKTLGWCKKKNSIKSLNVGFSSLILKKGIAYTFAGH